ncbi:hypothetical protein [Parafrigoribacterium humi]|uniref:hypothetical protein n=1 Tax=Parafrigoribacterium humi TaxID=3144664 RepID=UPI0032EB1BAA
MNELSRPAPALVVVTQSLLGVLFLVGVAAIVILPGFSAEVAAGLPEYAALRTPLLVSSIAITVVALVALACITLVLRSLLRRAILMRSELDEVV